MTHAVRCQIFLGVGLMWTSHTCALAQDNVEALRAELAQMRAEYEARVQKLEARIAELADEQARATKAAENAVQMSIENRKLLNEHATTPLFDAVEDQRGKGFEFHGYLRAGFGLNERGQEQQTFTAPFSLGRYRLGNEPDTYAELVFVQNWLNPERDENKPWFKTEAMVQAILAGPENFDQPTDLRLREAFAEAGNLLGGRWRPMKFWAGSRYYQRQDIHTLDYFFRDMSGIGAGVQEVPVGSASMDVAYIGSTHPTSSFLESNPPKSTIDVRIGKINVPGGRVAVWYDYAYSKVNQTLNGVTLPSAHGNAAGVEYRCDELFGGYNLIAIQAGNGAAANLTPTTQDPTPYWQESRRFIVTEQAQMEWKNKFSMMPSMVLGWYHTGQPGTGYVRWTAFGARPIYHFNKYFSIATDVGFQYTGEYQGKYGGWLRTVAIAPQISPAPNVFSRPVLWAFIMYGNWSDTLKGYVGGSTYATRTAGLSAGVQVESWW